MAMLMNSEIVLPLLDSLALQEKKHTIKHKKTLQQRQRQWERNQRKQLRNQQLSVLPAFTYDQSYKVTFINYETPYFALIRLIERAKQTVLFAMDTETDDTSKQPALIQIQFVDWKNNSHSQEIEPTTTTTIVIFEMCHLPSTAALIYPRIQQLIHTIFHSSKQFLTWGNGRQELSHFTLFPLFQFVPLTSLDFINVQDRFKDWYNRTYQHDPDCAMAEFLEDDDPCCSCRHRPYKNPGDTWSLQLAVARILKQFLDKSLTRSNWAQGLDLRLYQNFRSDVINYNVKSCLTEEQEQIRLQLVQYIVNDCLALTRVALTMGNYLFNNHHQ